MLELRNIENIKSVFGPLMYLLDLGGVPSFSCKIVTMIQYFHIFYIFSKT